MSWHHRPHNSKSAGRAIAIAYDWKTEIPGVFARHDDSCPVRNGRHCACGVLGYRASVRDWEANRRILSPQLATVAEARAWLADQLAALQALRGVAIDGRELGDVVDELLEAAQEGRVRDRWGREYTREGVRELRSALSYVDAELGLLNVADVRRTDVQGLVDRLVGSGLALVRVYDVVDALETLYAYAIDNDIVGHSPVVRLALPRGKDPMPPDAEGAETTAAADDNPSGALDARPRDGEAQSAGGAVLTAS